MEWSREFTVSLVIYMSLRLLRFYIPFLVVIPGRSYAKTLPRAILGVTSMAISGGAMNRVL